MEEKLLRLFKDPKYRPLNRSEMARALELSPQERPKLRKALQQLEEQGTLLYGKKGRYYLRTATDTHVTGTLRWRGRGLPELVLDPNESLPDTGGPPSRTVAIPLRFLGTALDGDHVMVRLHPKSSSPPWLEKIPPRHREAVKQRLAREESNEVEGEITKVLKRHSRRIIGTLHGKDHLASITPELSWLPKRIDLPGGVPDNAQEGDKVLVEIEHWDDPHQAPKGSVLKVVGRTGEPGVDILSIIHRNELPLEFPEWVVNEARAISETIPPEEIARREDWRTREVITIDPFDAKDFDDAIAIEELPEGGWELAVHIADVAHYVPPGSALDVEARRRGNSVYLVDRVIPMLPEELSNGICSLKPNVDRLTRCAILRFDKNARRTSARFVPAVIRSMKRLTYEEAFQSLEGQGDQSPAVTTILNRAWDLASRLRKRRFAEGALDLDFPETKVLLDDKGQPRDLLRVVNDISHQLIEECMLAANEAVAETITKAGKPSLYRVHEDPDEEKLMEFRDLVRLYGHRAGDLTNRKELQRLLKEIQGSPDEHALKISLLKSLKRAVYLERPVGHFGLAKAHYTHFTSPIRRYTDLIVHRVLSQITHPAIKISTPRQKGMAELGVHLSDTERRAADAEMESKRLKELEYFARLSGERPPRRFKAVVTEVARIGLFVELADYGIRGLIRHSDLDDSRDPYSKPAPRRARFSDVQDEYAPGTVLEVIVARVDFERRFIDFKPIRSSPAAKAKKTRRRKSSSEPRRRSKSQNLD